MATTCPECGERLPAPGGDCPWCGLHSALDAEIRNLVSRANLLRVRGEYASAHKLCERALELSPRSDTVLELMADIHRDQGRLEEALAGYSRAIEISPGNPALKARHDEVERQLQLRRESTGWDPVTRQSTYEFEKGYRLRETIERVTAIAGAFACGVILVTAILLSVRERRQVGGSDPAPFLTRRHQAPRALEAGTAEERRLLARLTQSPGEGPATAVWLMLDPIRPVAFLRAYLPEHAFHSLTSARQREVILREAYRHACAVHALAPGVRVVQVQVMSAVAASGGKTETDMLFAGSFAEEDLVIDPGRATEEELYSFAKSPVWRSGF